jgi:hypothetical protein
MYFYVDESGHTGPNLFDSAQPMLYYGVLSSRLNLDVVAEPSLAPMRRSLQVPRLHAAELGVGRLVDISLGLVQLAKRLEMRFDIYRVAKPDHAIICFFDQVFDQGMNPAVTWTGYWTPLRYVLLLRLASLFDEELARKAWAARIEPKDQIALPLMQEVCVELRSRVHAFPDARSRQLFTDALTWAEKNPAKLSYNVASKKDMLQITPNVIGFQSVMHGIAARIKLTGRQASRIVVDQQSQFNKAQKTLAEFYQNARGLKASMGPGMPEVDHSKMPRVPIEFSSSVGSAGLELTDVHLWLFRRVMEGVRLPPELASLVRLHIRRTRTDEISLRAIESRWTRWFEQLPELENMSAEQIERARVILAKDETRRMQAVNVMGVSV